MKKNFFKNCQSNLDEKNLSEVNLNNVTGMDDEPIILNVLLIYIIGVQKKTECDENNLHISIQEGIGYHIDSG